MVKYLHMVIAGFRSKYPRPPVVIAPRFTSCAIIDASRRTPSRNSGLWAQSLYDATSAMTWDSSKEILKVVAFYDKQGALRSYVRQMWHDKHPSLLKGRQRQTYVHFYLQCKRVMFSNGMLTNKHSNNNLNQHKFTGFKKKLNWFSYK